MDTYFPFVITPSGAFSGERGDCSDNLCQMILREIDDTSLGQALGSKYRATSLELRVLDKCVRENPDDVLRELFGRPQLLRIGRGLGLVKISDLNNEELVKIILLRLGFTLPPRVKGLGSLIREINDGRKKLSNPDLDEHAKKGIVVEALQIIEHVLKALVYFYTYFLWEDELTGADAVESKNTINEIIKREFGMARSGGLVKFTLGMLKDLLWKLNERVATDNNLCQRVRSRLRREVIIPTTAIDLISQAIAISPRFKHADDKLNSLVLDLDSCDHFLAYTADAFGTLKKEGVYPSAIRLKKEIHDEYGRTYIMAIDDEEIEWTVKTNMWLRAEKAYYMYSETNPVAVSPFIIDKAF